MKLHRLKLENYRLHANTEIEFADGLSAVVGQNGSGKSTILEAIGFALFGVTATRTGKELLRNNDAAPSDAVVVELSFVLAGATYEIRRELRGKNLTPSAAVTVDGKPIVAPGSGSDAAATDELEQRLGMGRDAFFTTIVARQKELNRLADIGPTERKKLLLRMLGVDAVEGAISKARANRRKSEDFLAGLRASLKDKTVLETGLAQAKQRLIVAATEKEHRNEVWVKAKQAGTEAQQNWARLDRHQQQFLKQKQEHAMLQQQLQHAGKAAADAETQWLAARQAHAKWLVLDGIEAQVLEARAWQQSVTNRTKLQQELATLTATPVPVPESIFFEAAKEALEATRQEQSQVRAEVTQATNRLRELESEVNELAQLGAEAPCPTCKRPMETHLPVLLASLEQKMADAKIAIGEGGELFANLQNSVDAARVEISRLEKAGAEAREVNLLVKQQTKRRIGLDAELKALVAVPKDWVEKAQVAESNYKDWVALGALAKDLDARESRAKELASNLLEIRSQQETLQTNSLADKTRETALATTARDGSRDSERNSERAAIQADHVHDVAAKDLERVQKDLADAKAHLELVAEKEQEARYWAALAGLRGGGLLDAFKNHLVGRIGPAVSAEAGSLMSAFTGGRYTEVTLDQEYNITVSDQGIPYPLARFSGGESDLVHLALRLAVSRLIAERSGADLRFLALDEVFGSLDEQRKENVLGALHGLRGLYAQVLLVTHHEALRDTLDATILVEDGVVTVHNG